METPEDGFQGEGYEEANLRQYLEEKRKQEAEDLLPMKIYRKYGKGIINSITGDKHQPIWSHTFRLTYEQTDGLLRYAWENEYDNPYLNDFKSLMNPAYNGRIHTGYTLLQLELPGQKNRLKISSKGALHFLSALNPAKVQTGSKAFDHYFITIAHPKSIVENIYREIEFLLDPDFGRSLSLITNFEDAITLRFYLQLRIDRLITGETQIENLLKHTLALVNKLNTLD
ncbi:hypothetical protein [Chitinophaga sp.]|uniref:hypothetical protein n=1 Tax=Chitinophaga sp. TaxID=1869181 RepID=UPI002F954155